MSKLDDMIAQWNADDYLASLSETDYMCLLSDLLQELVPAYERLKKTAAEFNETYKEDFHRNVCEQSMGCHCKPTSLDEVLS